MQLSLTVKGNGAEAVSYLLAKNPNNLYERDEKGFKVRSVYPVFSNEEVKFLIYVKPDPIDLVRSSPEVYDISHYINDREFAVSSLFVSAIRKALGTALNGKPQEEYVQWVEHRFDMEVSFGPIATDLPDGELTELFKPIGYNVEIKRAASTLRSKSSALFITLTGKQTIQNLLKHLFILIPVIDNYKHYFIDEREIEKVERYGEGWLENHPLKQFIVRRALRFQNLIKQSKFYERERHNQENKETKKIRLNELRYEKIVDFIGTLPKRETIVDLGAGEGKLSVKLGYLDGVKEILSIEPSNKSRVRAIQRFEEAEGTDGFTPPTSLAGSLYYYDDRLVNKDIMVLCEVIEHIDEYRIPKMMEIILKDYHPKVLIVTTPNKEYNVIYDMDETMRHHDHRFEWTRTEFQQKCVQWMNKSPYHIDFDGIGDEHPEYGHPTQMAIFRREGK
nr:3' terminal RNA ribose 2'-O-methyltransferase Hen1 [Neobacillus sp. Marseille-Q6967]